MREGSILRSRETEAMLAVARMISVAADARRESRGIHRRRDRPGLNAGQARSLVLRGLDRISIEPKGAST